MSLSAAVVAMATQNDTNCFNTQQPLCSLVALVTGISSLLGAIEYCNTYKQLPTAAAVALQDTSTDDVVSLLIPFVYAIAMETLPPTNQQHEVQVTAPFIEFHHKRPSPCRSSGQVRFIILHALSTDCTLS